MEKRKHARTTKVTDFNTQFRLGGQSFSKIHVSNIGPNGCCLQMPVASAQYLKGRPNLDNMILFHTDTRKYSLKGRIAWYDEGKVAQGKWIPAGVEFTETPAECERELAECVTVGTKKH